MMKLSMILCSLVLALIVVAELVAARAKPKVPRPGLDEKFVDKVSRPDASSERKSKQYMSYLNVPRLHFIGLFQADTATVNNRVNNYDISKFTRRNKLSPQEYRDGQGGWNPRGTNDWRLGECKVTSACYNDGKCENWHKPTFEEMISEEKDEADPVLGAAVADDTVGTAAKIVDLDPQDMTVSAIYGWRIRVGELFSADFRPVPLKGLWPKVKNSFAGSGQGESGTGAEFQSVLYNIKWLKSASSSRLMRQIHGVMKSIGSQELSINFNVDRFDQNHESPLCTWGRIAGSIGVHGPRAPPFHALARVMRPKHETMYTNTQFVIDEHLKRVFIDLGNTLPITKKGHLSSLGALAIGFVEDIDTEELNCSTKIKWIGEVPYRQRQFYRNTTGLVSFALSTDDIHMLTNRPLVMAQVAGNVSNCICREIMLAEADNGLEVRPFDAWVFRKEAGELVNLKGFVTRFGRLQPNVEIEVRPRSAEFYDKEPKINTPDLYLPTKPIKSDVNGIVKIKIHTRDPGNIRKVVDGQIYYYVYGLSGEDFNNVDADKTIRIHVYDNYTYTEPPNWIQHVYPIFERYANLFPVMTENFLDLGNYEEVVSSKQLIAMSMRLPESHPSYMPVTRDLSQAKKNMILEWLGQEHPLKGSEKDLYTLQGLRDNLQIALEIEHATIPPYLTALVSIKQGYNIEVQKIIKTVLRQEMLHMAMVSNILNAIGGKPKLYYRDFIPRYPSRLPGELHPSLVVPLEKCSIGLIRNVFMKIEEPVFTQQLMTDRRLLEIYEQNTDYVDDQGYAHVRELGGYNSVMMKREKRKRDREVDKKLGNYYDYEKQTERNHESERNKASVEENRINIINDEISRSASVKNKKQLDKNEDDLFFTRCVPREEEIKAEDKQRDDSEPDMQDRLGDLWNEPLLRHRNTIGGLYNRILKGLGYLTNCGQDNSIFTGDHRRQITPDQWMSRGASEKPDVFKVVDYRSAVAAVKEIVEQGEGSSPCNPLAVYANHTDELSHYFLFSSIVEGYNVTVYPDGKHHGYESREEHSKLRQCDETYNFDGHRIPFDPNGVWPIMANPLMSKYLKTNIFKMAKTFNMVYTQLLKNLETVFNGHPDAIQDTMGLMYSVTLHAKRLVSTPLDPKGDPNIGPNAAPTYTFTSD